MFRIRYKPCLGLTTANRITDPGLERLLVALSSYNQTNIKNILFGRCMNLICSMD